MPRAQPAVCANQNEPDRRVSGGMKYEPLIRRYEHNYFCGWVFATKRRGRRWVKYFSDEPHGRSEALRRARMYRDALLRTLPPASKVKRTYVRNTTGEVGVALVKDRTRSGRVIWRYVAQWPTREGGRGKATFSVALYGKRRARQLAIDARRRGLAALLGNTGTRRVSRAP